MNWTKPKKISGNRVMIETDCKQFCITKKDVVYQPMKLRGRQWIYLEKTKNIVEAKKIIEGVYAN